MIRPFLFFAFLFVFFNSYSQRIYTWGDVSELTTITDTFPNSNILILKSGLTYTFGLGASNTSTYYYKCKILKKEMDNPIRFSVYLPQRDRIEMISLRYVFENGKVVVTNNGDVRREISPVNIYDHVYTDIVVSHLEVGEEFEVVYELKHNIISYGEDFWGYKMFPSLENQFKIINRSMAPLSILSSIKSTDLIITEKGNDSNVAWKTMDTPGLLENPNLDFERYVPYVSFFVFVFPNLDPLIHYSDEIKTKHIWTYWYTENKENYNIGRPLIFENLKYKSKIDSLTDLYQTEQLSKVDFLREIVYVTRSMYKLVPHFKRFGTNPDAFEYKTTEYVTTKILTNLYYHVLKKNRIKFSVGMVSSYQSGEINLNGFNAFRVGGSFFKVEDGNKSYYLFPELGGVRINFNEIPYPFQGTKAVVFDPRISIKKFAVPFTEMIPQSKSSENSLSTKSMHKIDTNGNSIFESNVVIKGAFNTMGFRYLKQELRRMFGVRINEEKKSNLEKAEYYQSKIKGEIKKVVSSVADGSKLINVKNILIEDLEFFPDQELEAMVKFKYQQKQDHYFVFEEPVELELPKTSNYNYTSDHFRVSFKILQINPNTILFSLEKRVTRRNIPVSQMEQMKVIGKEVMELLNIPLVLKFI